MAKKKASPVKKTVSKKIALKKIAPKKVTVAKKTAPKKTAPKKVVVKKIAIKKAVITKKAAPQKITKPESSKKVEKSALEKLVDAAVEGVLEVKGRNISILDLRKIHNRVCDYYIICQADSNTQVNAIAGSVEEIVKKRVGDRPYHTEGFQNAEWVLVDYVTVVVHIFQSQIRSFYNLEALWADAEVTKLAFD